MASLITPGLQTALGWCGFEFDGVGDVALALALQLFAVFSVRAVGAEVGQVNLNHRSVLAHARTADIELADLREQSLAVDAAVAALFPPPDAHDRVKPVLCIEVVDLQGILDDVAAAEHPSDWLGIAKSDSRREGELAAADA